MNSQNAARGDAYLTYSFLMHLSSTLWKHQKALKFSDAFRGVEKGCIGNRWVNAPIKRNAVNSSTYDSKPGYDV